MPDSEELEEQKMKQMLMHPGQAEMLLFSSADKRPLLKGQHSSKIFRHHPD